jgi:hypothetical protein
LLSEVDLVSGVAHVTMDLIDETSTK